MLDIIQVITRQSQQTLTFRLKYAKLTQISVKQSLSVKCSVYSDVNNQ